MISCPLCTSNHSRYLKTLTVQSLKRIFYQEYQFDISEFIKQDIKEYQCNNCSLKFYDPCFTADNRLYKHLQTFPWYYPENKFEYDLVQDWINSNSYVLEIGCGTGQFAKRLATNYYVGLEFNPNACDNIKILSETIEEHSLKNHEKYDYVVSFQVLEHVCDVRNFIQASLHCVKKGGNLILGLPADSSWLGAADEFGLNLPPHHVTKWPDQTIEKISKLFNIELLDIIPSPFEDSYALKFVDKPLKNRGDVVVARYKKN